MKPPTDKNIKTKAILYPLIMFMGGIIFHYFYYTKLSVVSLLLRFSWELFYPCFLIGLVLEGIRWYIRKWKKSKGNLVYENPFWFDWIEASFSIWLLWMLALIIRHIVVV